MSLNNKIKRLVMVVSSVAVIAGIGVAISADAARADWHDHRDDHDRHRRGDWHGGYYASPPVVYGGPVYAPPPIVYGPSVGIALPGISIGIR